MNLRQRVILGLVLLTAAGCASSEPVPREAKLMYYGPAGDINMNFSEPQGGMVYITRGSRNSLLMAGPIGSGGHTNFDGLPKSGTIAVYWQPYPATRPADR